MNVGDVLTRVQSAFGDSSGVQLDIDDVLRWVNDAQAEIARVSRLLATVATAPSVAGQSAYAFTLLPNTILDLRSVSYDGQVLRGISVEEADQLVSNHDLPSASVGTGVPSVYWVEANQITLWPPPNAVKTLTIHYTRVPAQCTAESDTPELPVRYHPRIVEYCLAQAYQKDDNLDAWAAMVSRFESKVAGDAAAVDWSPQDVYPSITVSAADAGY